MRKGFELRRINLEGKRGVLSHVDIKSRYRIGPYKVDIGGFEDFLDGISFFDPSSDMIIVDEIGKMECLSDKFERILKEILDSGKSVILQVALKGSGLITEVKKRQDVKLFGVAQSDGDVLFSEIPKEINP